MLLGAVLVPLCISAADKTIRFEAENVLAPGITVKTNKPSSKNWDIWTNDPNNKVWSDGKVLRLIRMAKKSLPGKSRSELKFHIPIKKAGKYNLFVKSHRTLGFSIDDGKNWKQLDRGGFLFRKRECKAGEIIKIQVSPSFYEGKPVSVYIDFFDLTPVGELKLLNTDFKGKVSKGVPEGWVLYSSVPKMTSAQTDPGKKVTVKSTKTLFWLLTNKQVLDADPGDVFYITADIKNNAAKPANINFQFVTPEYKVVSQRLFIIPGYESTSAALLVVMPKNIPYMKFRFTGVSNNNVEFSNVKFEFRGNLKAIAQKADNVKLAFSENNKLLYNATNAEVELLENGKALKITGVPGKMWTVSSGQMRPAVVNEGVNVYYKAIGLSDDAKVRLRVRSFAYGEQSRYSITPGNWHKLNKKEQSFKELAVIMPVLCEEIKTEFDGTGTVILRDFALKRVTKITMPKPEFKKVPIPLYPAHKTVLGRGVIARTMQDGRVYLSWRMTDEDSKNIAFDIFSTVNGKETKLNISPVVQTTDFIVEKPVANALYTVRPAAGFTGKSGSVTADEKNYREYCLSTTQVAVWSVNPADLDGDGEFDYVVRAGATNIDPIVYFGKTFTPPYYVEAFLRDGRRLWSKNLGTNIETGLWYTPIAAADLNGDGKAEVICKASCDEDGDWREHGGHNHNKVMSGPEYVMVLDGMTGKEIARAPWPSREPYFERGFYASNYFARNMLAVFRPDGKTDCILALRGTYNLMQAEAWKLEGNKLVSLWKYNNFHLGKEWYGQGSHNTRIADIDGDGRDEVLLGAAVLDDDGSPLWTTTFGHPDYLFVGDITPSHPGMEVLTMYEWANSHGGFTCSDAKTGKMVWELKEKHKHVHHGYAADLDARYRGWESGGTDFVHGGHAGPKKVYHFSPDGEILARDDKAYYSNIPHFAYWDGDLQKELIGPQMTDHRGGDCDKDFIEGAFIAQFDSEGDWREEIAVRGPRGSFRVYGTTIPAMDRRPSLMTDEIYRKSIIANASGYLFDPSIGALPSYTAANLNMTVLKEKPGILEVVVSAPMKEKVAGKLKLTAPADVKLSAAEFDIDLKPAGVKVFEVKLDNPSKNPELIHAEWHLTDGRVLRGQVPAASRTPKKKSYKPTGIYVEAENFVSERGGNVKIRSDKKGVSGKSFSHWDDKGHAITWEMSVPKDGRYMLQARYAGADTSVRSLRCNGKSYGKFDFHTTGYGTSANEWVTLDLTVLDLKKGKVTIEMTNESATACNLDYLKLEPVSK